MRAQSFARFVRFAMMAGFFAMATTRASWAQSVDEANEGCVETWPDEASRPQLIDKFPQRRRV